MCLPVQSELSVQKGGEGVTPGTTAAGRYRTYAGAAAARLASSSAAGRALEAEPAKRDWYVIAKQPAPAPHLARPEGRAALTHMC